MVEWKTPGEVDAIDAAGSVVADVLESIRTAAAPGVTLRELDTLAADIIKKAQAKPAFLGYKPHFAATPYPAVINTSLNDAIIHGIPGAQLLREGDVLGIDCGAFLDGWCADAAITFTIGKATRADTRLVTDVDAALHAGIAAALPGNRLGDIGAEISAVARSGGYGMTADHGGHGVGRAMHEDPWVANDGRRGRGLRLEPGLVIAIEPMLTRGGLDTYQLDSDGWTVRTTDGSRAAHCEHTIAVTANEPRILTTR